MRQFGDIYLNIARALYGGGDQQRMRTSEYGPDHSI